MIGDRFKETATLKENGIFYHYGVIPSLKTIYGVKKDDPIYDVEFEVIEEPAERPVGHTNDHIYFAMHRNGRYELIQPTAEMFAMQFPWDVWKLQGTEKITNMFGEKEYYGTAVRIKPISYTKINE